MIPSLGSALARGIGVVLLLLAASAARAQSCGPDGAPCEVPCFAPGICIAGACETGAPVVCEQDEDPCTEAVCDPETGACESMPTTLACDDGSVCTIYDTCEQGACTGIPVVCDDGDACTTDRCEGAGGGCVFEPIPDCGAAEVPTMRGWPKGLLLLGLVAATGLAYVRSG